MAVVRLHIARDHLADIRVLDARLKSLAGQIAALVTESGTTLTTLYGIGPLIAGRIFAEAGNVARFAPRRSEVLQIFRVRVPSIEDLPISAFP